MDIAQASTTLQTTQDPSGAWGYRAAAPSTELTALCLLALRAGPGDFAAIRRGEDWLRSVQRPDGGWPPYPNVGESTWLTAMAMLALGANPSYTDARGIAWLLDRMGRESTFVHRLRTTLLGGTQIVDDGVAGWPWYPDTAAWVAPTSFSVLALAARQRRAPAADLAERIVQGRRYLLARVCHDGGWNHGSSRALGYDSDSYPETTGLALAALHGVKSSEVAAGIAAAKKHLSDCHSLNGAAWLALGLLSHGEGVPTDALGRGPCRDTSDVALYLLAAAAIEGKNSLLE
jgi:hypothetical protein